MFVCYFRSLRSGIVSDWLVCFVSRHVLGRRCVVGVEELIESIG